MSNPKKNKKVQYLLIVLVVVIWGTVAFRMITWNSGDDEFTISSQEFIPLAGEEGVRKDSFVLKTNYKDPFLGQRVTVNQASSSNNSSSSKKYQRKAPTPLPGQKTGKMPKVSYLGYSINDSQITRVRISINQKAYTLKQNETIEGVKIMEMHFDSVVVKWKGELKTIKRNR